MEGVTTDRLAAMRVDYDTKGFDVGDLERTWHEQFAHWFSDAVAAGVTEPNAMVLATAGTDGRPSSRTVLCKAMDERGFAFYTNYTSAKSHDLRATRYAAATFPWYAMQRQVNVRGTVEMVSPEETQAYWASRPRGAQLGAWASAQSVAVRDRRVLDDALATITHRFEGQDTVPQPSHWIGWRIVPDQVEFWQGRGDRLHDRLRFELNRLDRTWSVRRLAP
jgi:pyridoxamine 5'-phosphate oxidase